MGGLVVVVALREGAYREAFDLLRQGPPLDVNGSGLDRYEAFLSSREALLVLKGAGVGGSDRPRWEDLTTWRDAARWERCAQSPPRVAESVHSWERAPELTGVFFGPLPGPGDSEGGDNIRT